MKNKECLFYEERIEDEIKIQYVDGKTSYNLNFFKDAGMCIERIKKDREERRIFSGADIYKSFYPSLRIPSTNFVWHRNSTGRENKEEYLGFLQSILEFIRKEDKGILVKFLEIWVYSYEQRVFILSSDLEWQTDTRKFTSLFVRGGEKGKLIHLESCSIKPCHEFFKRDLSEEIGLSFLNKLKIKSRMKMVSGKYTLILQPGKPGILFHEIAHGFEADQPEVERLFDYRFSPVLTIVDDPTLPNLAGSMKIDDEGIKCCRKILLKKGIVKSLLTTTKVTDSLLNLSQIPNIGGNGRRASYCYPALPRQSNLIVESGERKLEDVKNGLKRAIIVEEISHCFYDATKSTITGVVSLGYFWNDEKKDLPFTMAFTLPLTELLTKSEPLNENPVIVQPSGICGKSGQSIWTAYGQPTVIIHDVYLRRFKK